MFRQRCGRLIHDQDARVLRQCLGDLDPLAIANRECAHGLADIEVVNVEGLPAVRLPAGASAAS